MKIRPIDDAPKEIGTRILAYVSAAESLDGWMEMERTQRGWRSVIQHPVPNACLRIKYFTDVPEFPGKQEKELA